MLTSHRPQRNGIAFLMCLRISVATKSFYLHCLIICTNGGEYSEENADTDSFPASRSTSIGCTFWILTLALLANHVSTNKLLSLVFLIYKWWDWPSYIISLQI